MRFHFQSFVSLTIVSNGRPRYDRYFLNEYRRIDATMVEDDPPTRAITLEVVDKIPDDLPGSAIRQKRRFKKLFTFEFAITGAGAEDVRIYFVDHPVSRLYATAVGVFVQAHVLEPLLYWSLLNQGVLLMHCAGVTTQGRAVLMPAQGGTGKTTTSIALLSRGYGFLGDDLILVDPASARAFPYPRPLHVFTYNIRNLQNASVPLRIVGTVYFKNVLRYVLERLLGTEFLISTRVHADEIIADLEFSGPARMDQIVFLIKEGESRAVSLDTDDIIREVAEKVIGAADLNESLFELIEEEDTIAHIRDREMQVAGAILRSVQRFQFLNTRKLELSEIDKYIAPDNARDAPDAKGGVPC